MILKWSPVVLRNTPLLFPAGRKEEGIFSKIPNKILDMHHNCLDHIPIPKPITGPADYMLVGLAWVISSP